MVKENTLYGLQRLEGKELYERIDAYLSKIGDAKVNTFYSDENQITIAVRDRSIVGQVRKLLEELGFTYYTSGENGNSIMLTFKPFSNGINEAKKVVKLNETQLRKIVAESVKNILKEMNDEEYFSQNILVDIDGQIESMTPDEFYNFKNFVAKPRGLKYHVLDDAEQEAYFRKNY